MWGIGKEKEMVEVRGIVSRFGMRPFDEVFRGYTLMLEDDGAPYIVRVKDFHVHPTFVELTQPGDVVSFTIEKGSLYATNFRNEALALELEPYLVQPEAQHPTTYRCGGCGTFQPLAHRLSGCPNCRVG